MMRTGNVLSLVPSIHFISFRFVVVVTAAATVVVVVGLHDNEN